MSNLIKELKKTSVNLDKAIKTISETLETSKDLPDLRLRIQHHQNRTSYYLCDRNKSGNGHYTNDVSLASRIAQHDYDMKVQNCLEHQSHALHNFLDSCDPRSIFRIYDSLSPDRKKIVRPFIVPDDTYAEIWCSQSYEPFTTEQDNAIIPTNNGEMVRSKSEKILADRFAALGIPYKYEVPLQLSGGLTIRPDFTLLNVRLRKEFYWEHFGMMDDPDYVAKALKKIERYIKTGFFPFEKLLISHETKSSPLDMKLVEYIIQRFLL